MPASAPAAFVRIVSLIVLRPEKSATELSMTMSLMSTNGLVSPDAIVETMTLGTPSGSARIAAVPTVVPPEPPIASTPRSSPRSLMSDSADAAPFAMTSMAAARFPAWRSSARSPPPRCAVSAALTSGTIAGSSLTPKSRSRTAIPSASSSPRRNRASSGLVSSEAIRTTAALICWPQAAREAWRRRRCWRAAAPQSAAAPCWRRRRSHRPRIS